MFSSVARADESAKLSACVSKRAMDCFREAFTADAIAKSKDGFPALIDAPIAKRPPVSRLCAQFVLPDNAVAISRIADPSRDASTENENLRKRFSSRTNSVNSIFRPP